MRTFLKFKGSIQYLRNAAFVFLLVPYQLSGQNQDPDTTVTPKSRQELWPELEVYYRMNTKFRLMASYSATKLRSSSFTDGEFTLNLDYFALPLWRNSEARADSTRGSLIWFRTGVTHASSPEDDVHKFEDYMIITEVTPRFYLPQKLLLSVRNRVDWRWRNEVFQPRYRLKVNLEREFETDFLNFIVYTYGEYFLNFDNDVANRWRLAGGWEIKVTRHINFETYFTHQFEGGLDVLSVNAIGIKLKVHF